MFAAASARVREERQPCGRKIPLRGHPLRLCLGAREYFLDDQLLELQVTAFTLLRAIAAVPCQRPVSCSVPPAVPPPTRKLRHRHSQLFLRVSRNASPESLLKKQNANSQNTSFLLSSLPDCKRETCPWQKLEKIQITKLENKAFTLPTAHHQPLWLDSQSPPHWSPCFQTSSPTVPYRLTGPFCKAPTPGPCGNSGDVLGCHNWQRGVLLASGGWRPLLNILQCPENDPAPRSIAPRLRTLCNRVTSCLSGAQTFHGSHLTQETAKSHSGHRALQDAPHCLPTLPPWAPAHGLLLQSLLPSITVPVKCHFLWEASLTCLIFNII
ncbi:uncharacterized protein LOC113595747 [Acinonyx jubatus]|uniref:Uncharacterized protein LOC113595747 n=1 Tax=Acinonyx jubatus TaxID=32536 RepID=A0A6J1YD87_ACIJB|nr:uncharacterized protein LOC113595747 [Acinonyx jubatus]